MLQLNSLLLCKNLKALEMVLPTAFFCFCLHKRILAKGKINEV